METSYEQVLEAVRRYPRDLKLQELPRDTSGRQHAQCSCPAHDGDGGTSLHITYDQSDGKTMLHCFGAEHCDAAAIADALGLKIIDLFDQQSGPQGHWAQPRQLDSSKETRHKPSSLQPTKPIRFIPNRLFRRTITCFR